LIDACRPGQHDPQRPELAAELAPLARELESRPEVAEALQRSERFDLNVRAALDDVPLPEGLTGRVLARCEAAVVTPAEPPQKITGPSSRRRVLAQWSVAASLLVVFLAIYPAYQAYQYVTHSRRPVTADELAQAAVAWFDACGPGASWSKVDAAILAQYPLDPALRFRPLVYRRVDAATVAYNLSHSGKRAILFVHLPKRPHPTLNKYPYGPLPATGGISLGAWERSQVVYVIGVTGSDRARPVDEFVSRQRPI
jgi:hypothetical protein